MSFFLRNLDFYIPLFMGLEAHVYTGWRLLYFHLLKVVFCANIVLKYSRYGCFVFLRCLLLLSCVCLAFLWYDSN